MKMETSFPTLISIITQSPEGLTEDKFIMRHLSQKLDKESSSLNSMLQAYETILAMPNGIDRRNIKLSFTMICSRKSDCCLADMYYNAALAKDKKGTEGLVAILKEFYPAQAKRIVLLAEKRLIEYVGQNIDYVIDNRPDLQQALISLKRIKK
jgi:hypothetical protein